MLRDWFLSLSYLILLKILFFRLKYFRKDFSGGFLRQEKRKPPGRGYTWCSLVHNHAQTCNYTIGSKVFRHLYRFQDLT